jgi:hypothetical protein
MLQFTLPTTLDIIKCYVNIPWDFMKTVADGIDTPLNGITLQYTLHTLFDDFAWCLHATVCLIFVINVQVLMPSKGCPGDI